MHAYFPLSAISKGWAGRLGLVVTLFATRLVKTDSLNSDGIWRKTLKISYVFNYIDLAQRVVKPATVTVVGISYNRMQVSELLHAGLIRAVNMAVTHLGFREEGVYWMFAGFPGAPASGMAETFASGLMVPRLEVCRFFLHSPQSGIERYRLICCN